MNGSIGNLVDRTVIRVGSPGSLGRGVRLNGMYEIETLLAQGGMGEVYKGFNIQTGDPVAIKMILPELARNADAFALFRREASTLHNLQHEAIVRYFVFSVDPDLQRAYLAMEFVDGPSLTHRLAQGPLSVQEANILRKRIAGALDAAHRFGVIHRDISSDNVILPGNDLNRAKIIDFGIARSQRPGEATLIGGGFAGKYNYVAPEQLGLAGGEVTAKSDIYSFGLVLAEALRGRPIDMNGTQVEIIEKRRCVPDLSDIDLTVRPLLQAMLQPLPADRPSMAAVVAWGEIGPMGANSSREASGDGDSRKVGSISSPARERGSSHGRIVASLGVLIVLGSIGGTLYVYRDVMPWSGAAIVAPAATPTSNPSRNDNPGEAADSLRVPGSSHKLPPLPDISGDRADLPQNTPAANTAKPSTAGDASNSPSDPIRPHVPTADEIVQSSETLAAHQPGGSNAHLSTSASPGQTSLADADAAQKTSETAQHSPVASSAPKPSPPVAALPSPRASQPIVTIDDAVVGKDYVADLPPFSDSGDVKTLVLYTDPNPPEGLNFADLGSGLSRITGRPIKSGQYSFQVLAKNPTGAIAQMTTRIMVAQAPQQAAPVTITNSAEPVPPPGSVNAPLAGGSIVASISPSDRAAQFLRKFDGGPCFLARPLKVASDSMAIQGIGSDKAAFERFYGAFIHETGVEPALTVRLIDPMECPAVDLIRAIGSEHTDGPKIELAGYDVGNGKPLAGTVSNLAGRRLDLLLVSSDGNVYRLDSRIQQGGGSATFSVPVNADANSAGVLQLLLAIASPRQLSTLTGFKAGATAAILPRLHNELAGASGALEVEFFKLVK
jgi:serine/threonine protein kinase